MATFNAGAIEANLTLGRSNWSRDLKKTQAEIQKLEQTTINIAVDLDTENAKVQMDNLELFLEDLDNSTYSPAVDLIVREAQEALDRLEARLDKLDSRTVNIAADADIDNAMVQLDNLEREMNLLETDTVNIGVDVDSADAEAKLIELSAHMQRMSMSDIDVNIDIDGYPTAIAQMATLEAQIGILNGQDIDIDVDVDKAALAGLVGSGGDSGGGGGSLGLLRILLYGIIALAPVLAVASSSIFASLIAISAAATAAGGAAAILGVGLFGLIKRYQDAKDAGEEMSGPMGDFADAIDNLKDVWDGFLDKIEGPGFSLMADAIDLVAEVLPDLAPLFNTVADAMGGVLDEIGKFVGSAEYKDMLDFFGGFGVDMLVSFIHIGGNVIQFFGRLFQAIEPFAREMMAGLEDITAGWAEWADDLENNQAFQDFVDNAREYGPMLLDMLGSMVKAFLAIGQALEPFAGPMLTGLTFFFDLIANMDPTMLTILVGLLGGLFLAFQVIIPMVTALIGLLPALGTAFTIATGPIGLIVLAIVALIAMFVYMWKTNEDFRKAVIDTWNAIKNAVEPIITDIVNAIKESWGPVTEWASEIFDSLKSIFLDAMIIIKQIVRAAMAVLSFIWEHFGDDIIKVVKGAFQIIGGVIRGAFQILKGIFHVIKSVLTGDWKGMVEGLKDIWKGLWTIVASIIRGAKTILSGIFGAIKTVVMGAWNGMISAIKSAWTNAYNWVTGKFGDLLSWLRGLGGKVSSAVSNMWSGIATNFKNVINDIIGWWNNLNFSVDIPDKIPGLPDSFTIETPNVPGLATGAYLTSPMLAVVGEGRDPEVIAPEPVLERIVQENSGGNIDYGRLAAALAAALAPILVAVGGGVSAEDLERLIEAASVEVNIDARSDHEAAGRLASAIGFELRLLGYGGKNAA